MANLSMYQYSVPEHSNVFELVEIKTSGNLSYYFGLECHLTASSQIFHLNQNNIMK